MTIELFGGTMSEFSFGHDWPWLGAIGGMVLLCLLFFTRRLQADTKLPRWHDRTWLAWLAMFAYLAHNVEEYGIDMLGRRYEFPASLNTMFVHKVHSPPNAFYLAVNLSIVWFSFPLAALVSKRHPLVGLAGYSIMAINCLGHVGGFFASGYNPGLLTAVVLFIPLTLWVAHALFGPQKMSYKGFCAVILVGIIAHAIVMGSIQALIHDWLSQDFVVAIQVLNAVLTLVLLWMAEKILGPSLYRTGSMDRTAA
jgi:hypothetical protein